MSPWSAGLPVIKRDELLSSWLARIAVASGCEPRSVLGSVWPAWRACARDLDRGINATRSTALTVMTGMPEERIRLATLRPLAQRVHTAPLPERAAWRWITALGVRGPRRRTGPAFCPHCLVEAAEPYFRIQGRLAWHTACSRHAVYLVDRCVLCRAPVMVHRASAGPNSLAFCTACGADLRQISTRPAARAALQLQQRCDAVARVGFGRWCAELLSAPQWFAVAAFFVALRRQAERAPTPGYRTFFEMLREPLGEDIRAGLGLNLEFLAVDERARLFTRTWAVLDEGADTIREALLTSGLSRQAIAVCGLPVPASIARLVGELPDRGHSRARSTQGGSTISRRGVARRVARLARRAEASQW